MSAVLRSPGFTAEAAVGGRSARHRARRVDAAADSRQLSLQRRWGECSDGDPALCYFCDDTDGCACDWYYGSSYVVSSDCGSR